MPAAVIDSERDAPVRYAIEVWFVDFDASETALNHVEALTPRLSSGDIARIAGMAHAGAARERRLTLVALRALLAAHAGDGRHDRIDFRRSAAGKPHVAEPPPWFSAAHTSAGALIALSAAGEVGVDLEAARDLRMTRDRRRRLLVAAHRLTAPTGRPDAAAEPDISDAATLIAWVRLEALAKATGEGIGRLLTREGVIGAARPAGAGGADSGSVVDTCYVVRDVVWPPAQVASDFVGALAGPPHALPVGGVLTARAFPRTLADIDALVAGSVAIAVGDGIPD